MRIVERHHNLVFCHHNPAAAFYLNDHLNRDSRNDKIMSAKTWDHNGLSMSKQKDLNKRKKI
ncbi:MAG: hypothetical protein ACFFDN_00290 [Candidatus Hodarchaeota archaeon]